MPYFCAMKPNRVAVIDLGTNTFQLGIADIYPGRFDYIFEKSAAPKLGKGGINQGLILDDAMERGFEVLRAFQSICAEYNVANQNTYLMGTSALRNARNAAEFTNGVKEQLNLDIAVIDGLKEAQLIARGIGYAAQSVNAPYLIMDIGGGSVEFIIVEEGEILWKHSFEIGGQRLMERFFQADPIPNASVSKLKDYLQQQLLPLLNAVHQYAPKILMGSAGSFETLLDIYNAEKAGQVIENSLIIDELPMVSFYKSYTQFLNKSREERLAIAGMIPLRVDMIVVASVLIEYVIKSCQIDKILVSTYALKEGKMAELAELMNL